MAEPLVLPSEGHDRLSLHWDAGGAGYLWHSLFWFRRRSLFATVAVFVHEDVALLLLKADKHKEHHTHYQQASGNDLAHQWGWDHASLGHA